jgi:hypothetical protein
MQLYEKIKKKILHIIIYKVNLNFSEKALLLFENYGTIKSFSIICFSYYRLTRVLVSLTRVISLSNNLTFSNKIKIYLKKIMITI